MDICFITDYFPPHIGGAEVLLDRVTAGLAERGHRCCVITSWCDQSTPRIEQRGNLRIVRIGSPALPGRLWFNLLAIVSIWRYARMCQLILASTYGAIIPGMVAGLLTGKKVVLLVYEFMGARWRALEPNPVKRMLYRAVEKMAAAWPFYKYIAISEYTAGVLRAAGIPAGRIERIICGGGAVFGEKLSSGDRPALRERYRLAADDYIFLGYGRAGISKGFELLVQAIPLVLRQVPTAVFILVLTPGEMAIWRRLLNGLRTIPAERYRLVTTLPRDQLGLLVQLADCVVIPSLTEGFGFTTVEAAGWGKKIVATRVGAIPEVIYGCHVLVGAGSAEALAKGCIQVARGSYDRTPPKRFDWERTVGHYEQFFQRLING